MDDPVEGAQRVILIVGAARWEGWKRAPMKRLRVRRLQWVMEELVAMDKEDVP